MKTRKITKTEYHLIRFTHTTQNNKKTTWNISHDSHNRMIHQQYSLLIETLIPRLKKRFKKKT